jgi:hypothetical protein
MKPLPTFNPRLSPLIFFFAEAGKMVYAFILSKIMYLLIVKWIIYNLVFYQQRERKSVKPGYSFPPMVHPGKIAKTTVRIQMREYHHISENSSTITSRKNAAKKPVLV